MKVICKQTTAKDLDLKEITVISREDYDFGLTVGKEYLVMGLMINKRSNCVFYLFDEFRWPNWYPYMLFDISDNSLPQDWYIKLYDKKGPGDISYISGFYELCNDEDFYELLIIEGDPQAIQTYFKRKKEAEQEDEWEQLRRYGSRDVK